MLPLGLIGAHDVGKAVSVQHLLGLGCVQTGRAHRLQQDAFIADVFRFTKVSVKQRLLHRRLPTMLGRPFDQPVSIKGVGGAAFLHMGKIQPQIGGDTDHVVLRRPHLGFGTAVFT